MHAHSFVTQERTQAPSQSMRGVAGSCAPVEGVTASCTLRGRSCPAPRRGVDARYPWPGEAIGGLDGDVDFGRLVEGGPV
jgi:hypothetical protein